MSKEVLGLRSAPKFIRLPLPRYISEGYNADGGEVKWIGIEVESLDGDRKKFLWAENLRGINLRNPAHVARLAKIITVKKLANDVEITIGPAINLELSDVANGKAEVIQKRGWYGLYVEEESRPGYNFFDLVGPKLSPVDVRRRNPVQFEKVYSRAWALLSGLAK